MAAVPLDSEHALVIVEAGLPLPAGTPLQLATAVRVRVMLLLLGMLGLLVCYPSGGLRREGAGSLTSQGWPHYTLQAVPVTHSFLRAVTETSNRSDFSSAAAPGRRPPRVVRELTSRDGWPHFFSKVRREEKEPVVVAFIGGSVTANDCWRPKVMELLRRRYTAVNFTEINAAIGGTGSILGAFRVDQDVIGHRPDLVFIEFAINDLASTDKEKDQTLAAAEGILRKLRKSLPTCDIALVYVTGEKLAQEYDLDRDVMPEVIHIHERLADHYRIPSIHMGLEIVRKAAINGVVWRSNATVAATLSGSKYVFGWDGVHPRKETGCTTYAQAVGRSLRELEHIPNGIQWLLPPPIHPNNYEEAQLVTPDRASMSPAVHRITPAVEDGKPYLNATGFLAQHPGATFRLPFYGSTIGILMMVGPFAGDLVVSIDAQQPRTINIFDTYCYFPRKGFYLLYDNLDRSNHTLIVDVSPDVPPKRSILARKQRQIEPEYLDKTEAVVLGFGFV